MASINDMYVRILNELKRPSLSAEAALAVADAIEYYSTFDFWFLESSELDVSSNFNTSADVALYPLPSDLRELQDVEISVGGQRWSLGTPWTYETYRAAAIDTVVETGQPSNYAVRGDTLYLYVAPNDVYPITLTYRRSLGVPPDGEENAWTNVAEPLIRTHAKQDLLTNVIRDQTGEAERLEMQKMRWLAHLQRRTQGYGRPRGIVPSCW